MGHFAIQRLKTYRRLSFRSVADVGIYRIACRAGFYRWLQPVYRWPIPNASFFTIPSYKVKGNIIGLPIGTECADKLIEGRFTYFSKHDIAFGNPPYWFLDPFTGRENLFDGHWSSVREFDHGDIKAIWEASRFGWVVTFALAYFVSAAECYLGTLNEWLNDWLVHNRINAGINWRCGQEASMRVINIALAGLFLGQIASPSVPLLEWVRTHLRRISPTLRYALAQNNNHGTSEAAAIFVGGSWLQSVSHTSESSRWLITGIRLLENRVEKLIEEDGSFSQYSLNYHRLVLDTLSFVEIWRRLIGLQTFSNGFYQKCRAATEWLRAMISPETGDGPNIGANDGAFLLQVGGGNYRDFRPSVQLASILFCQRPAYNSGNWDAACLALGVEIPPLTVFPRVKSKIFPNGGYVLLREGNSFAVVRFARFRFRPSHADCLHLDLWHKGENILRDGGTYSYNTGQEWLEYFSGTASHNTVQFDGRDQMPRLGRFLFGDWLKMIEVTNVQQVEGKQTWTGSYRDSEGACHRRCVEVDGSLWTVFDDVSGFKQSAVLRWRLMPGDWTLEGGCCSSPVARISVDADVPLRRMAIVTGWESRHYLEKTEIPVLEVEIGPSSGRLQTVIELTP